VALCGRDVRSLSADRPIAAALLFGSAKGDCSAPEPARISPAPPMINLLQRIAARAYGSAVAWSFVFTAVRAGGNLLVLPLMLHKLSPEDLGLWYVFLSLGGLASLIDFGFYPTMSRVTAFLWAGAEKIQETGVTPILPAGDSPPPPNYRLLADLVRTMQIYYRGIGILITALMGIFGSTWIIHKAHFLPDAPAVLWAWLLFLAGIFVNITSGMWHPLLSGINQVRLNQQIFVCGLIANYLTIVIGLLFGAGLFAPVAGFFLMGAVSRSAARWQYNRFTKSKEYAPASRWSSELLRGLWPTAWRTGIVTLGIYATLNLGTLICSAFLGLNAAASYGLSMQLVLAAVAIAASFIAVKIPLVAQLHALGREREIGRMVFPRMRWYWVVYAGLATAAVLFGDRVIHGWFHSQTPLLPKTLLVALFLVGALEGHHGIFRELAVTAHRNPFATPVVVSGLLIVILSSVLVARIGLWGLIIAPGLVQICFNNWWIVLVGLRSMDSTVSEYLGGLFGRNCTAAPVS
jgi:O-antigen/teichoic acid export membrane protein